MIEINLLPPELKTTAKKMTIQENYLLYIIPGLIGIIIFIHLFLGLSVAIKKIQLGALSKKWNSLESQRKTLEDLQGGHDISHSESRVIQQAMAKRINWAKKLNKLSLKLPLGVWFNEITVSPKNFILKGSVISLQQEEMNSINKFIENLKSDTDFLNDFNSLELGPIQRRTVGGYDIVDFILSGSPKAK